MKTTLNRIREHHPRKDGREKLLKHLVMTRASDEPLSLLTVLDSNGLDDALWCLRAVDGYEKEKRLFAVWCARQVEPWLNDQRSINAINVAEKYAYGQATKTELDKAREAAIDAARDAACDAACDAARDEACDAALISARAAAAAKTEGSGANWRENWAAARAAQKDQFRRILEKIKEKTK